MTAEKRAEIAKKAAESRWASVLSRKFADKVVRVSGEWSRQ
jgi:hypothetical protein